jgi:hypothetical protein
VHSESFRDTQPYEQIMKKTPPFEQLSTGTMQLILKYFSQFDCVYRVSPGQAMGGLRRSMNMLVIEALVFSRVK